MSSTSTCTTLEVVKITTPNLNIYYSQSTRNMSSCRDTESRLIDIYIFINLKQHGCRHISCPHIMYNKSSWKSELWQQTSKDMRSCKQRHWGQWEDCIFCISLAKRTCIVTCFPAFVGAMDVNSNVCRYRNSRQTICKTYKPCGQQLRFQNQKVNILKYL